MLRSLEDISLPTASANLNYILDALDSVKYTLEYPNDSNFAFEYQAARMDGVMPNNFSFPVILNVYFEGSLRNFLSSTIERKHFFNFEDECLQEVSKLSLEQVNRAHQNLLFLLQFVNQCVKEEA